MTHSPDTPSSAPEPDDLTPLDAEDATLDVEAALGIISAQRAAVRDTVEPDTRLRGATVIGEDALIGPGATLTDTVVADGAQVRETTAERAEIGPGATVGPYTYLRPDTHLAERAKAGAFVEVKNANIGADSKGPHLTYVGDADIGENSNIGCSSVFVNYDGVNKSRSTVGDHAHIGSDNTIVAPVSVGDGANHTLRLAIAVAATAIAFGAVIASRLRAAKVDREGRLDDLRAAAPSPGPAAVGLARVLVGHAPSRRPG